MATLMNKKKRRFENKLNNLSEMRRSNQWKSNCMSSLQIQSFTTKFNNIETMKNAEQSNKINSFRLIIIFAFAISHKLYSNNVFQLPPYVTTAFSVISVLILSLSYTSIITVLTSFLPHFLVKIRISFSHQINSFLKSWSQF